MKLQNTLCAGKILLAACLIFLGTVSVAFANAPTPPGDECSVLNTNNVTLAMFGIPDQAGLYYQPDAAGLKLTHHSNGTATLMGEIVNKNNPNQRWQVAFNLFNKQSAAAWTAAGNGLMIDETDACFPVNTTDWEIWEIANTVSTFSGKGDFAGRSMTVYNWTWGSVIKRNFVQLGTGAGVISCEKGMAAWLAFQGSHEGSADFFSLVECAPAPVPTPKMCEAENTPNITLAMFDIPDQAGLYYQPGPGGLKLNQHSNGTATLTGEIVNKLNANQRWNVSLQLYNKQTAAQWTAAGNGLMIDETDACFPVNTSDWEVWEIANGISTFTGAGAFAGRSLNVYNWVFDGVVKRNFLQIGTGAGVISCDYGMATWLAFQGTHNGSADFYALTDCSNSPNPNNTPKCDVVNTENITLAMFGIPDQAGLYYKPTSTGLFINLNADGTATLTGIIENKNNANQRWMVNLNLLPKKTAAQWIAEGNGVMTDPIGCNPVNTSDWEIWEIVSGTSTFTGMGAFSGRTLNVYNWTWGGMIKRNFVQTGTGAGVISCDPGMGVWLAFQGSHEGSADFFAVLDCGNTPPPPPATPKCEVENTHNVALALFGIPDQNGLYYKPASTGLFINLNANGTATLTGIIENKNDANQRWMVNLNLLPKKTAAQWIAEGNGVMTDPIGCNPVNTSDWEIWEIVSGTSTFTGMGAFTGRTLSVYNWTWGGMIKRNFVQTGTGAGVISCDPGMGVWLAFQGTHEGSADFFANLDCSGNKSAKSGTDSDESAATDAGTVATNNAESNGKAPHVVSFSTGDELEFVMMPNPADVYADVYTVEAAAENVQVKVFDTAGRLMVSEVVAEGRVRINTAAMPVGLYFVRMEAPGQAPTTHILQVRR